MTEEIRKVRSVYIGKRLSGDGRLAHFFEALNEDDALDGKKYGAYKIDQILIKGNVYTLSLSGEKGFFTGGPNKPAPEGPWPHHHNVRDIWIAQEAADEGRFQEIRAKKKFDRSETDFDKAMAPLVAMMNKLSFNEDRYYFVQQVQAKLWKR